MKDANPKACVCWDFLFALLVEIAGLRVFSQVFAKHEPAQLSVGGCPKCLKVGAGKNVPIHSLLRRNELAPGLGDQALDTLSLARG